MKNLLFFVLFASMAVVVGCSNDSGTNNGGNNNGTDSNYFPLGVGNLWVYKTPDSTQTIAITGTTTYNGKSYYLAFDHSDSSTSMLRKSGSILYALLPSDFFGTLKEVIQLDEKVGSAWSYDLTVFDSIHFAYNTVASGLTRNTNGTTYNDVLHVHLRTTGESFGFPIDNESDIYYAKGIGLIESSDQMIRSYVIK